MILNYLGFNVNYEIIGNGSVPIVFLHGWGGSAESFLFICKYLNFDYKALFVDFPPFGKSDEPNKVLTIYDYANIVEQILIKENFTNCIMVGHSFGGRVALILSSRGLAKKLILTSSAGMKPRRKIKYYFKVFKYKLLKRLKIKARGGSRDYNLLSDMMKKTFINIVNENLENYALKVNIPTIIFWGKKDKETPYYMAKRLKKLIKHSELIAYKDAGHFCYLEKLLQFVAIINYLGE